MSSIFRRYSNSARLGDLLVQAGVLSPPQLQEAVKHSRSKKLQIGQVLVMSGHLTPKDLQVALEAQSMLRDHTIDINIAVQCIKVARKIGASFADVLEDYDASAAKRARTGKLGELLVDASIISQDQLSQAMEQGLNTGMPLGRMLVLNEAIQAEFLEKALDIQVRLRDEMMTREEAIKSLQELAGVEATTGKEEEKKPEKKKQIVRLGELLVMAGILSENDVMDALEWGLANQQPIGTVLVSQQLISQELLDAALFFQTCVKSDELDPLKACECLSEVFSTGVSPEEALKEVTDSATVEAPDKPPIDYRTLVKMARVVTDEDIDKAFDITAHDAALIGKVLVLTGFMDVPTLQASLRCYQMVSKGWLSPDDAIAALDYCLHQSQSASPSFEQALRDLKWSPESGLKMRGEKNLMKQTRENMAALSAGKLTEKAPEPLLEAAPEPEPEPIAAAQEIVEEEEESVVPKSLLAALAVKSAKEETVTQPEPEPEPEPEPIPVAREVVEEEEESVVPKSLLAALAVKSAEEETVSKPEPEPLKVEVPATPPTLDTLLGPLRNGEEPHEEVEEPAAEAEIPQEQLEEEKIPVAAVAREEETGGGLGALLQGLGGSSEESSRADAPPKKMGSLLGNLIQKSAEPEDSKPLSIQEPVKAEADADPLKGLSAEELLAQIEQGAQQQHDSAKGIKRKGRHADTIMPEAAKARQLAALIAKEPSAANKFAGAGAGDQDEDALGEAFERLAERHFEQGNYKEAQVIYERILVHKLNDLGPESPDLIEDYNNLAMTLCIQKFFDKAEPFMKKAVTLYEKREQKDPLVFADYLHSLGTIHYRLDKLEEAEDEFSRVLEIRKAMLDRDHEDIGRTLTDYARVVKKLGQNENAEAIYKKAKEILKRNS
ncbi:tetratricopeptide repeat protein [bacterium]|nr:tetratricopeptide repeat protein [bacterium]